MNFEAALTAIKAHECVTRAGWNGRDMWITLAQNCPVPFVTPDVRPAYFEPFIFMRTAQRTFVPWLASQADLLADDWLIVTLEAGKARE